MDDDGSIMADDVKGSSADRGSGGRGRRDLRVTGRVQGVGYRWWAMSRGEDLGLSGTVRNAPDGSVEVRCMGPWAKLRVFEAELWEGPGAARVLGVEEIQPYGELPAAGIQVVR